MRKNNMINAIRTVFQEDDIELKFLKHPINTEICKNKKKITQERKDCIEQMHEIMDQFKIKVNNTWIYMEFKDWIGHCLSKLLICCDKIINYKNMNNQGITIVLEKFRNLFVNKSKYKGFMMKFLNDNQINI